MTVELNFENPNVPDAMDLLAFHRICNEWITKSALIEKKYMTFTLTAI